MNTRMNFAVTIIRIVHLTLFMFVAFLLNAQSATEWYNSAQERIDTLRKGEFGIRVNDRDGQPFVGDISVRMTKHEYPFGIAFDLYEGEVNNGNVYTTTNSISAAEDAIISPNL